MRENTVSKLALRPGEVIYQPMAETLAERGSRYGSLRAQGLLAQRLKETMRAHFKEGKAQTAWDYLTPSQREALDNIATKISRIINGDPAYLDNWHDIAGYATLVENELKGIKE